jgi:hypothetical protein
MKISIEHITDGTDKTTKTQNLTIKSHGISPPSIRCISA